MTIHSSPQTQADYVKCAEKLTKRYAKETGLSWDSDPTAFVRWAAGLRPSIRPASWRVYKAAMVFFLGRHELEDAASWLAAQGSKGCLPRRGGEIRTSQMKQKKLPPEDLVAVCGWLRTAGGKWGVLAAAWLHCGVLTGLRPVEWKDASIEDGQDGPVLLVRNGKYAPDNGRACGEHRRLGLSNLDEDRLALVSWLCAVLTAESHAVAFAGCRKAIRAANAALWPGRKQHVSLYSARHQFAADAKADGMALEEIAACMGHLDRDTATKTYGRRASGRSPVRVTPARENVEIVERHATGAREKDSPPSHKQAN